MKLPRFLLILLLMVFLVYACAPSAAEEANTVQTSLADEYLTTDFADAASLRNQLAYGTLKLADTSFAVSADQAQDLLPLWQAIVSLSGDANSVDEELLAVQDQIIQTLSVEQIQFIAEMQITNAELSAFYAEQGVVLPTPAPDVTKVPGQNGSLSQEQKEATKTAAEALGTPVGTGGGTGQVAKTILFDLVLEYLAGIATP